MHWPPPGRGKSALLGFRADALVHLGTHGAMEFMPGKQVGLTSDCWPFRLAGDIPHLYIYSVNNPAEGAIARRYDRYLWMPRDDRANGGRQSGPQKYLRDRRPCNNVHESGELFF